MNLDFFTPHLRSRFHIETGNGPLELELIEAKALKASGPRKDPFALLFRGPRDLRLPQRVYRLNHDQLESVEVFLIPVGLDTDGLLYEAVWN